MLNVVTGGKENTQSLLPPFLLSHVILGNRLPVGYLELDVNKDSTFGPDSKIIQQNGFLHFVLLPTL